MASVAPPANEIDACCALSYVRGRQTPSGGYCFYRDWRVEEPSAADTFHAVASLQLLAARPADPAAAVAWLRGLQDESGGYPDLVTAWYATEALASLGVQPRADPRRWLHQVGEFLYQPALPAARPELVLRETARYLELGRRFDVPLEARGREAVVRILRILRDPSGPYPRGAPTLAAGAAALRVATAAGLLPDRRLLDYALACEDRVYGFRALPHGQSTHLEVLAAGCSILGRFGVAPRHAAAVRRTVAACQRRGGGFGRHIGAIATLRATWLALTILHQLDEPLMASP